MLGPSGAVSPRKPHPFPGIELLIARVKFRYIGAPWKFKVDGAYRNPGDVVELSETAASRWADKLEAV